MCAELRSFHSTMLDMVATASQAALLKRVASCVEVVLQGMQHAAPSSNMQACSHHLPAHSAWGIRLGSVAAMRSSHPNVFAMFLCVALVHRRLAAS